MRNVSWLHDQTTDLLARIREAKSQRAFPFFRRFENVGPRVKVGGGSYINFTSNDYLGLSQDRRLVRSSIEGTRRYGTGLGSARPQATSVRHEELERRLARWLSREDCAVFTTGYQALVGVLSAFLDDECSVVADKLSHASIIDGLMLATGLHPELEVRFFKHNNVDALRRVLGRTQNPKKMVIAEGLYSVDGDMAPLAAVADVCREQGAVLVVDDAHGLGALGPTGRGVGEIHGVLEQIDILIGTFSKAFGSIGGFVCADATLVDFLKLQARSFVYSASLPIAQVEAALAALDVIERDSALIRQLEDNARFFRDGLVDLGFDIGDSETHITPIMIRDEIKTLTFGAYLYHGADVIMMPFVSPGVAPGKERLRCNVTAAHSRAEMGYTLEALARIGQMLEVLPAGSATQASQLQRALWLAEHKLQGVRNAGLRYLTGELGAAGRKVGELTRNVLGSSSSKD